MHKLTLERYSIGIGDRFAHQGCAQLAALQRLAREGVHVTPVWNKSNREHTLIGSRPEDTRRAADAAVKAAGWTGPYRCDADHIGLKNADLFMQACDFFTLDVADFIGTRAETVMSAGEVQDATADFLKKHRELTRPVSLPGLQAPLHATGEAVLRIAANYLPAVRQAGSIYRHIRDARGTRPFIVEVSMDETDTPQTPLDMLVILAAIADEGIPAQTIAPKFSGRFNKGVDYVGAPADFEREFFADVAVVAYAVKTCGLPETLKLSVHSGSDKFSLYPVIRRVLQQQRAGLHLKTAGTTWLEEVIGLAAAGGDGLDLAREIYTAALGRYEELAAPYATVIDIRRNQLPDARTVRQWDSTAFVAAVQHDPACAQFNPSMRQLLHVAFKVAAEMGPRFLTALDTHRETIARHVTDNLYRRHLQPLFATKPG